MMEELRELLNNVQGTQKEFGNRALSRQKTMILMRIADLCMRYDKTPKEVMALLTEIEKVIKEADSDESNN